MNFSYIDNVSRTFIRAILLLTNMGDTKSRSSLPIVNHLVTAKSAGALDD